MTPQETGPLGHALTNEDIVAALQGAIHASASGGGVSPHQFTQWVTDRIARPDVDVLAAQAAGARLRLLTVADQIRITVVATRTGFGPVAQEAYFYATSDGDEWTPARLEPSAGRYIYETDDGGYSEHGGSTAVVEVRRPDHAMSPAVDVILPASVALTIVSVEANAPVSARPKTPKRRWLHHGSSISHGGHLGDSRLSWPALVGDSLGVESLNASLPGNSLLDPCVAEELAGVPADVVSLELGINIVNWDSHTERTFIPALHGFLDHFHRADPDREVILISPFHCEIFENHGGPLDIDSEFKFLAAERSRPGALTLIRVRELINEVVRVRPKGTVRVVDGQTLLGKNDQATLDDRLHPNARGTRLIAERFLALVDADISLRTHFSGAPSITNE